MLRPTVLMTAALALLFVPQSAVAAVDYATQVQPIFMEHCTGCHGKKKGAGKLRLHTPAAIQEKWDKDEHLIVKGDPEKSELYERLVLPAGHKKLMPKKADPLSKENILVIRQWIEEGAVFPVVAEAKPQATTDETAVKEVVAKKVAALPALPLPKVEAADAAASRN